jgi:hypothetical protein
MMRKILPVLLLKSHDDKYFPQRSEIYYREPLLAY